MEGEDREGEKPATARSRPRARGARVTITTNLPDKLPVVTGEAELLSVYLGELVARLAANDNGDEP